MDDSPDFESIVDVDEEEAVVADAEAEFFSCLEGLYVSLSGADEAVECDEDAHGGVSVDAADIGLGWFCPDDALHWDCL